MQQPNHPDFWLMSEIVLDLDAAADDGLPIERITGKRLDLESIAYMARNRALRGQQLGLPAQAATPTAWFEGFIVGTMYAHRKTQQDEGNKNG